MGMDHSFKTLGLVNLQSQATAYARLAESEAIRTSSLKSNAEIENLNDEAGLFTILPVSAESTGMLQNRTVTWNLYLYSDGAKMLKVEINIQVIWVSMASISHLPFFSYAFASHFLSTLLSLSHASIEQPSSIKCPIPASLEPNSNISFGTPRLSHSEASIEQPSSIKCPIPGSLEPNSNISLGIPQLSHSDILPVSEPLPGILDSETLVASTEQQSSIKPPIPASHEPDPDRSSATPSSHSDILPVSEPFLTSQTVKLWLHLLSNHLQ
ncbi:hypothetical protein SO802_001139 [Lithocarpus litseifolius]|uniref:Uncharacterized protein n=1 Tax=Lithocarpus litseifolius TaxID=425828 RepID=A0AAW2DTJ1_9ROSI